jgi:transcriptional/translational regulatory protein YebC/TACO1
MSEKKYTISLTYEELQHVKEAINNRNMFYYEDYVEFAKEEEKEYEEKQQKILQKLNSRLQKKWSKLFN